MPIATAGHTHRYELTGIASYGGVDSLGFASIAVWDVRTAQTLLGREGRFDSISISAKPGTSPAQLVEAVRSIVPATLQVNDSAEEADDQAANVDEAMGMVRKFLLGFARHRAARRRVRDLQHAVDHGRAADP